MNIKVGDRFRVVDSHPFFGGESGTVLSNSDSHNVFRVILDDGLGIWYMRGTNLIPYTQYDINDDIDTFIDSF